MIEDEQASVTVLLSLAIAHRKISLSRFSIDLIG